jgi:hypothetical protein
MIGIKKGDIVFVLLPDLQAVINLVFIFFPWDSAYLTRPVSGRLQEKGKNKLLAFRGKPVLNN